MHKQFETGSSRDYTHRLCDDVRIVTSGELVWLKRAFFTACRICNTASWKNMLDETKIATKQPRHAAVLWGWVAGEVRYA